MVSVMEPAPGGLAPEASSHGSAAGLAKAGRLIEAFPRSALPSSLGGEARDQRLDFGPAATGALHAALALGKNKLLKDLIALRTAVFKNRHKSKGPEWPLVLIVAWLERDGSLFGSA